MKVAFSPILAAIAALVLVSCGGGDTSGSIAQSSATRSAGGTSTPATTGHNAQDVMFAQMMIPHHQQAIVMARWATTKAASPRVRELAARIERAQQPEIEKMTGWLKEWGAPMPSPGGMHMGQGMMSEQEMRRLGSLSGKAFDTTFLQMMIRHHQGAIVMARDEQAHGDDPGAKALAASIITSQSAEIATMRRLLENP